MQGQAFVFINVKQAAGCGHVGWGFALDDGSYFYGSSDHLYRHSWWDLLGWLRYARVSPGAPMDYWAERGTREQMLQSMSCPHSSNHPGQRYHIWYHKVKQIDVQQAEPQAALAAARALEAEGWSVIGNNCVHQAHKVLSAYGVAFAAAAPPPFIVPKWWFARLPGTVIDL